jgi:threonine dehydrogenase-like Zn-dependent dehydrogenase
VLKTTVAAAEPVDLSPAVIHELTIAGPRCGDLRAAIGCPAAGRIDPRPLIDARYPLADGERGLDHAARRVVLKVLLEGPKSG